MIHVQIVYFITAVASLENPPITDEMVVSIGGAIRVSGYALPSTQELTDSVLTERVAKTFIHASALGKVHALPTSEKEAESSIFRMRRRSDTA